MTNPPSDAFGEHRSSTEYLREYGELLVDMSQLLESLDASPVPKSETHYFSIENIDATPLPAPQSVVDYIGPASSVQLEYVVNGDNPSISLEFFGDSASYRTHRTATTHGDYDAVLSIPPVDSFVLQFQASDENKPPQKPYQLEPSSMFNKRIKQTPKLSKTDFLRTLLLVSQPKLRDLPPATLSDDRLNGSALFDNTALRALIESSGITAQSHAHFLEYAFLADDSALLRYGQENGQPTTFEFSCIDPAGETLRVRGSLAQSAVFEFPQDALENGINNDTIVTLRSFPPTLSELKFIRKILNAEKQSLPPSESLDTMSVSGIDYGVADQSAAIAARDLAIENALEERKMSEAAHIGYLNDKAAELIDQSFADELKHLFDNDKDQ